LCALAAALAQASAPASARDRHPDPRIPIDTREYPRFKPVLLLSWEARVGREEMFAIGTGFLISPCHALTNRHFLADALVDGRFVPQSIRVGGGFEGRGRTSRPTVETGAVPIAWGDSNTRIGVGGPRQDWAGDWALLKLDWSIGDRIGYLAPSILGPAQAERLVLETAGFPEDRYIEMGGDAVQPTLHANLACRIDEAQPERWRSFECRGSPGASGSPGIVRGDDGRYRAVAMLSGGDARSLRRVVFTPLSFLEEPQVKAALERHACSSHVPESR
jgi:hypothetical protein